MLSRRLMSLTPYVPGEQPRDRSYLKLNTNESPYPPSPRIEAFLREFDTALLRLYPDPWSLSLRQTLAKKYGLTEDHVFVGNGSDEILSFVWYAFFDGQYGRLLFPRYTYSFYPVYCDYYEIPYRRIPMNPDFSLNVDALIENEGDPSCGIVFPNPNAPTGIALQLDKIRDLLERYPRNRVVVIDEAYIDFGGESAVGLISSHENLLIIRTCSKSFSLAGLRLGYAMGSPELIRALFITKDSFNSYTVGRLTQAIGEIALEDEEWFADKIARIIASRTFFSAALKEQGWQVLPSKANFVLARKPGVTGQSVYEALKERGILVRFLNVEGIRDFVRITIGTKEDMDRLLEETKRLF
ncbi:MAG: Histidinol-phosphate aminotransferase [Syntrophus sp. PtaU1.Bin208]|nr:MAG: Histidinol-phosphate aminotransferase [Syntrophus sp. PtaU1.Bin208]